MRDYKLIAVVTVLYITVNIHNYFRLIIIVTNNFAGLIFFKIGYKDLNIYFSNKLSL